MAGYSGTPLPQKLGIKSDHRVVFVNAPANFAIELGPLPAGVVVDDELATGPYDVIVYFCDKEAELKRRFGSLARRLNPAAGLWIAWPKKSSGVATDLVENAVRDIGLETGLVDNKVCAVDETWSGLRFVIRVQDRPRKKSK